MTLICFYGDNRNAHDSVLSFLELKNHDVALAMHSYVMPAHEWHAHPSMIDAFVNLIPMIYPNEEPVRPEVSLHDNLLPSLCQLTEYDVNELTYASCLKLLANVDRDRRIIMIPWGKQLDPSWITSDETTVTYDGILMGHGEDLFTKVRTTACYRKGHPWTNFVH